MKRFTKSILALALLMVGATSVSAEKLYADLTKMGNGPVSTWDGATNTMTWTTSYNNMVTDPDFGFTGTYDISSWQTINVTIGTLSGEGIRVDMIDATTQSDAIQLKAGNKTHTINLTDFKKNGTSLDLTKVKQIRIMGLGGSGSAVISEIYLERPDDPLSLPKDNLTKSITVGKIQSPFAKTTASWNVLQQAISDGEDELVNGDATSESLVAAKKAIDDAIAGFEYEPGYVVLSKEMANTGVDYVLNESTGLPFGNGSVSKDIFADLSNYDNLIVIVTEGKPRFCMNRQTNDGQIAATKAESKMIDINPQGGYAACTWATEAYQTIDGNKYTVDLQKIADDWNGEVKLHCIKGANYANVTVTDMLLYRAPKTATIGATKYATFSADKAVKIEGVDAYVAKLSGSKLVLTKVTEVPANTGVILNGDADDYDLPVIDEAAAVDNDLKVSDGTVAAAANIYVLADGTKGVGFYQLGSGTVPAGKAYLQLPASSPALEFIGFDMETTGISGVAADVAAAKEGIFNLSGQRVSKATKGLYIVNGKKVLVK